MLDRLHLHSGDLVTRLQNLHAPGGALACRLDAGERLALCGELIGSQVLRLQGVLDVLRCAIVPVLVLLLIIDAIAVAWILAGQLAADVLPRITQRIALPHDIRELSQLTGNLIDEIGR